ncbi:MAG: hypothetical protein AVDCRST_MAG30-2456, partial [uncultured Solirubrobacteraceae bacterium]
ATALPPRPRRLLRGPPRRRGRAARVAAHDQHRHRAGHRSAAPRREAQRPAPRDHGHRPRGDPGARGQRRPPRADGDGGDAQPDRPLPRAVHHGLQLLELLLDAHRRALRRGGRHGSGRARAAQQHGPPGQLAELDGGLRAGQRPERRPGPDAAVPPGDDLRRGGRRERQRRLRVRPARLPVPQRGQRRQEVPDRARLAYAGAPGDDPDGPPARPPRPDLHGDPRDGALRELPGVRARREV